MWCAEAAKKNEINSAFNMNAIHNMFTCYT